MNKLTNQFESNKDIWTLIPNNNNEHGEALFDGLPIPSNGVLKLIGLEGVKKIDEILKTTKRAKEILYGIDSDKVFFDHILYFARNVDKEENLKNVSNIFKRNVFLICGAHSYDYFDDIGTIYGHLKSSNWKTPRPEMEDFRDYAVYLPEDVNYSKYGSVPEWESVIKGNESAVQDLIGKNFISDLGYFYDYDDLKLP